MSEIKNAIEAIIERARVTNNIREGDFVGEDGLYYCGKCRTKKQTIVELFGEARTVPCICKCRSDEIKAEKEAQEARERFERIMQMRSVGFPEKAMKEWTFDKDDGSDPVLMNAMKKYVEHFGEFKEDGKGLLLFGSVGTGKTFLAACVANALIDKGIPCLVTNFARIANEVQGLFDGRQRYFDSLNSFPLLVVDDLGAERRTEAMQEIVYNVIDSRDRAKLPIIVTTNLTREELLNASDVTYQRIYSRLFEMCTPIEVKGKDRRAQALREGIGKMKGILGLV